MGLFLAAAAVLWSGRERAAVVRQWESRLSILAEEEATLVQQWVSQRQGDARLLAGLPTVAALAGVRGGRAAPQRGDLRPSTEAILRRLAETYGYRAIAVFDADGRTAAEFGDPVLEEAEHVADAARRSGRGERALLRARSEGSFSLAIAEPIFSAAAATGGGTPQTPLGAVLLIPDPAATLFRLFNKDLLPTTTDEAYIVAREGNVVASISPRRLLHSASAPDAPAGDVRRVGPAALRSQRRFGEFLDYRNQRVLAATRLIPQLGWGIVVKIDREEALAPLAENVVWVAFSAIALFLCVTGLGLAWRRRSAAERHRRLAERDARYRTKLEEVRDGVVVQQDGFVLFANPAAMRLFGVQTAKDFVGRRLSDFVAPESQDKLLAIGRTRLPGDAAPERIEIVAQRADRSRFDLEITAAPMELQGRPAMQATLRDITRPKEMERFLRQSEERYRLLFERNLAGVYRSTPEGQILDCNEAFARIMGYDSREEAMAQPAIAFWTIPETRERLLVLLRSEGSLANFESRGRRKDGSEVWVLETVSLVRGDPQHPEILEGMLLDITQRKRSEEALQESEERFRHLTEASFEGVAITDRGTVLDANRQFARLFGFEPEEIVGRSVLEFVAPESQATVAEKVRKNQEGTYEAFCRRRDGSTFPVEVSARHMPYQGRTVRVTAIRDITERKRAQDELNRSEERYRSIVDLAPIGIYQSRRDGSLITANAKFAEILGYGSPEELLAVNLKDIYANPAERDALIARYETEGGGQRQEVEWKKKDGSPLWVELDAHAIGGEGGKVARFEGFVHDVSERRRREEERRGLEQQLAQSQKIEAIGHLAGGVAHDFNNLLTAIIGYTELLIANLEIGDPRRAHADQVRRCAQRAASLTQQLLAFSRRQVLKPKILDLNEVLAGMEEMLRRTIGEDIELKTRPELDLDPVQADPGQLEQAILNLVVNARDAMPDGGRLTIETANTELDSAYAGSHTPVEPGHYAMIAVTDSGLGMAPEVRGRIFDPFFTTKKQARGLGLSTTYGIIKQSGGYIWCYSEPGRGTTFKIYLPSVREPETGSSPAPAATVTTATGGAETILLVEDEPEVRSLVLRLLKMQGYTVVAAANPDEALAITRDYTGAIDLMVTDVVMPGMSGRQLADRLAGTRPQMRVLFVSGYTDDAIVHHGVLDAGTAFLQKPFTPQALARKVREVMEAPPGHFKVS